jgi:hypothetical protein
VAAKPLAPHPFLEERDSAFAVARDRLAHVVDSTVRIYSLEDCLAAADAAGTALVALGIPLCPSCELLDATLEAVGRSRSGLWVGIAALVTREDWAAREWLLWPRGIHVSRACVPTFAVLRDGEVLATRQGGGPAAAIDGWLTQVIGPPDKSVDHEITGREAARLGSLAALRVRHLRTYGVHAID